MNELVNTRKIIVLGCPGSGKSTFSRKLHEKTGLSMAIIAEHMKRE